MAGSSKVARGLASTQATPQKSARGNKRSKIYDSDLEMLDSESDSCAQTPSKASAIVKGKRPVNAKLEAERSALLERSGVIFSQLVEGNSPEAARGVSIELPSNYPQNWSDAVSSSSMTWVSARVRSTHSTTSGLSVFARSLSGSALSVRSTTASASSISAVPRLSCPVMSVPLGN
jgi:hypothetical protein